MPKQLFNIQVSADVLEGIAKMRPWAFQEVYDAAKRAKPAISTSDPMHPTNKAWVMSDPLVEPPPNNGEELLVIQQGGVLIKSPWVVGYLAWAYHPSIPDSVKKRMYGR